MEEESQYQSKFGSFSIEINGECVSVIDVSNPTDSDMDFDMLAAMYALGVATNLIYFHEMLGDDECVRISVEW